MTKSDASSIDGVVDSEDYYASRSYNHSFDKIYKALTTVLALYFNTPLDTEKAMKSFHTRCADAGPEG
jgi:hypothetical protein